MVNHFVYMIQCKDKTLYTGYSNDVKRRIEEHEQGKGAKYTRGRGPFRLVYVEVCQSKSEALKREAEIKKLSRGKKMNLIKKGKNVHGLEPVELLR